MAMIKLTDLLFPDLYYKPVKVLLMLVYYRKCSTWALS